MDWDAVVVPIVLIVLYFFGYFLYLGLRRLMNRLTNPKAILKQMP